MCEVGVVERFLEPICLQDSHRIVDAIEVRNERQEKQDFVRRHIVHVHELLRRRYTHDHLVCKLVEVVAKVVSISLDSRLLIVLNTHSAEIFVRDLVQSLDLSMTSVRTDLAESFLCPGQRWDEVRLHLRGNSPVISAFVALSLRCHIDHIVPVVGPEAHPCLT